MSGPAPSPLLARALLLGALPALGACAATLEPGWSGQGAEPFDQARTECAAEAAGIPDREQHEAAFEGCMASRGWTRPPR